MLAMRLVSSKVPDSTKRCRPWARCEFWHALRRESVQSCGFAKKKWLILKSGFKRKEGLIHKGEVQSEGQGGGFSLKFMGWEGIGPFGE